MPETIAFDEQTGAARVALETLRADASQVTELRLGQWFASPWRRRVLLRLLVRLPEAALRWLAHLGRRPASIASDAAYWREVRRAASRREWVQLTRSSYVALYYHRLAGELKPGQERIDIAPGQFAAQLRLLARLGFTALSRDDLLAFHGESGFDLPRRAFVITVDDGFQDCVAPLAAHGRSHAQLFVPTAEVGGRAWWAGGEPVATWDELRSVAAGGVSVGSHSSSHRPLDELDERDLRQTLAESRRQLERELAGPSDVLAYPHGRRNERVTTVARECGFRLAFTTDPGRNGWGTDPLQLRRIGIKAWDSRTSFVFKVLTGGLLAPRWEQRRIRLFNARSAGSRPPRP